VIKTDVAGEVREHHFRCVLGHEFSVLIANKFEVVEIIQCIVLGCQNYTENQGDNAAEVSENPVDLLEN
jgi:hypothetical protein